MNIFSAKSVVFGEAQVTHLNRSLAEFFEQARGIRVTLGSQAYLLDKYISYLLEAANRTIAINASSSAFETDAKQLNQICLDILCYEDGNKEHPFYRLAKGYIDTHPLPYQELPTKHSIYCAMLTNDFLRFAAEKYQQRLEDEYGYVTDICDLRDLYNKVCGILGGEEPMERLNLLFRQRFLIATAMQIYLQGLTNQLMFGLTMRDRETQKQIFQIILDEHQLSFEDRKM